MLLTLLSSIQNQIAMPPVQVFINKIRERKARASRLSIINKFRSNRELKIIKFISFLLFTISNRSFAGRYANYNNSRLLIVQPKRP